MARRLTFRKALRRTVRCEATMPKTAIAFAATVALLLACQPAQATGVPRAWVSGHGTDAAGCGAPTNPCRSLQYVLDDIIAPGGEIDILDPAGYGAIGINKAVSIVNDGVGTAGVQSTDVDAINIQAGSTDSITLRGLNIDGLGVAQNGVELAEAGSLTMANCVIRHFTHDGVYLQQHTGQLKLSVINTISADNGNDGFDISPGGTGQIVGVIDHSEATTNVGNGVVAWGLNTQQSPAAVLVTVSNSNLSNNNNAGVYIKGKGGLDAVADVVDDVSNYDQYGFYADVGSAIELYDSDALLDFNSGLVVSSSSTGYSYGENRLRDISGTLVPMATN
jgi:hypothetical protein